MEIEGEGVEPVTRAQAEEVLAQYWGYPSLRPGQWEAMAPALAGRDVLAILPTGGGKSICYQVPALLRPGLTLVISPLIALMQDQVTGLTERGVPAAFINSTLSQREVEQRLIDAEFGRYRLLYIAPERLQTDLFQARAERLKVSLLAVDEAHCISEWGHHFRPAYMEVAEARELLGGPPVLAVTATATPQVRRDIVEHLGLRSPQVLVRGFDRPNLVWSIFRTDQKRAKALDVIGAVPGSGVVYAATRRGVEGWAEWLSGQGVSAQAYHGGMAAADREAAQEAWLAGAVRVMVATNAFGMGIDKADVRFVIHVDVPGTLEGYYQEAGRGGRDGDRAHAVLLFQQRDAETQRGLIEQGHPAAQDVQKVYDAVCSLGQVPLGTLPDTPLVVNTDAVVRVTGLGRGQVKQAVELLARQEAWQVLPPRRNAGYIRFSQPADVLREHAAALRNRAFGEFFETVLRTVHADAYSGWWELDLRLLTRRMSLDRARLLRGLAFLAEHGLCDWRPPDGSLRVELVAPRARRWPIDDVPVQRARRRAEQRLEDMLRYARSVTCRRHFLLSYFGEPSPERCGRCDVCLGRHRPVVITPDDEPVMRHILRQVAAGLVREAWFEDDEPAARQIDGLVDWLVQEAYLRAETPLEDRFRLTEKAYALMEQWKPREQMG